MKNFLPIITLAVLLFSCKKDQAKIDSSTVRLTGYSIGVTERSFEYDAQGRIIKYLNAVSGGPKETLAIVTYNVGEATIIYPGINNAGGVTTFSVKYNLNAEGKPSRRIAEDRLEFFAPSNIPQRTFKNDTSSYQYDNQGLLLQVNHSSKDSAWSLPSAGSPEIAVSIIRTTKNYVNTNAILQSTISNGTKYIFKKTNTLTTSYTNQIKESATFTYNNSYANSTDFSNSFLLNEFEVFYFNSVPMDKLYGKLPSNIVKSHQEKNAAGNIIISDNSNETLKYVFNGYGFVSSMETIGTTTASQLTRFTYSQ